jgi:hypothetical protein
MPATIPLWASRLNSELDANDATAKKLLSDLSPEQLNWKPSPAAWSIGQCLEHLSISNEVYLQAVDTALDGKPHSPVEQLNLGLIGGWFLRNFVEPSRVRAPAPGKVRPASTVESSVLTRYLSSNQLCRDVIARAADFDVNRIRFRNPFLPGVRFKVGTGLSIIPSHGRRHLLQAQRVQDSPGFPR